MARKKAGAHHGGAWKVAYADFVTAMMALFMVLWISAQDQKILISTSRYFQTPFNSPMDATSGILPFDMERAARPRDDTSNTMAPQTTPRSVDLQFLNSLAKDFFRMLHVDEDLADRPLDIQVTSDGLRVTLYDRTRRPLFVNDTPEFTEWGRFVMQSLAWMIDRQQFRVIVEGHTRKGLVLPKEEYTSWELSSDRANSARRALTLYAVDNSLIERVSGYADTRPLPFEPEESESNQRVTLSLNMLRAHGTEKPAPKKPAPATPTQSGAVAPQPPATH
ncbi:MAG: OmpA family protein [Opitutaceae bacterium]|nr:OmpA family protein [Verrucomicrobiales bacterium]